MALGTVIRSFATPAASGWGITFDGESLWLTDSVTNLIYEVDTLTGTVKRSFGISGNPRGLTFDGRSLWQGDAANIIYKVNPVTETIEDTIAVPPGDPGGLSWDGSTLWATETTTNSIIQIDPATKTVKRPLVTRALGLTWDGLALWGTVSGALDMLHQIDPLTGTYKQSVATPGSFPRDLAWDGRTLWHIDAGTNLIYQIAVN